MPIIRMQVDVVNNMVNKTVKHEESNQTWEGIEMNLSPGDVITSKKGILSKSSLTGKFYCWTKAEYLGNGLWRIIGGKKEVEINGS